MNSLVSMSFDHMERVISTHEWLTLVVELNFGSVPTAAAEPGFGLGNLVIGHVNIASAKTSFHGAWLRQMTARCLRPHASGITCDHREQWRRVVI
jgi:hypothetical protein